MTSSGKRTAVANLSSPHPSDSPRQIVQNKQRFSSSIKYVVFRSSGKDSYFSDAMRHSKMTN